MKSEINDKIPRTAWPYPTRLLTNFWNDTIVPGAVIARDNGGVVPARIIESDVHPSAGKAVRSLPRGIGENYSERVGSQKRSQTWRVGVLHLDGNDAGSFRNNYGIWSIPYSGVRKSLYQDTVEKHLKYGVIGSECQNYDRKRMMSHKGAYSKKRHIS